MVVSKSIKTGKIDFNFKNPLLIKFSLYLERNEPIRMTIIALFSCLLVTIALSFILYWWFLWLAYSFQFTFLEPSIGSNINHLALITLAFKISVVLSSGLAIFLGIELFIYYRFFHQKKEFLGANNFL